MVACPISVTLGYLKGVLPEGVAAAWLAAIVKRAARLYISRLLSLAERQEQEQEQEQEAEGEPGRVCVCGGAGLCQGHMKDGRQLWECSQQPMAVRTACEV